MKIKKEYLTLALVIAALALYLVLSRGGDPGSGLPQMAALDSAKINRMVITHKETPMALAKKDEQWFILPNNYPADPIKIKNMIKTAAELTVTAVVSESGNYRRYNLDKDNQIKIQIYGDDQLLRDFTIGRTAPTPNHTFVLVNNETHVFHALGKLESIYNHTMKDLRDKTALSFDKEAIASLQIQKGDQNLTLTKSEVVDEGNKEGQEEKSASAKETQWQSDTGNTAANSSVQGLMNALSGLKCEDYMDDNAKQALKDATWTVKLKSASDQWTLSVFTGKEKDATQIPGASSSNNFAFLLSKSRTDAIEKQIEKLLNPTPKK